MALRKVAATLLALAAIAEGCDKCVRQKDTCGTVTVAVYQSCGVPSKTKTFFPPATCTRPPTVSDVPSCAQVCVTAGDYGGCREGDVGCICRNRSYLQGLTGCVAENCRGVNCQDVVDFATDVCGSVGVTDLPIPSCSPAPPTVTDVPSCGQVCVTAGSYGGCREGDVGCICRNTQYLESLSECVGRSCNVTGCAEVASFAGDLCSSVGVTSLPMPSCGTLTSTMVTPQVTDVPNCAQNCVLQAGGYGGCSEGDVRCICSNQPLLERYRACIAQSCDTSGCQSVAAYATTLCRNYGVSTLPALSCPAVIATTTERTTQITTAPAQTVRTTVPFTIRPPAETVTASTVSTLTIISTAPPLTISITQTQYGPTATATSVVVSTVETTLLQTVTLPASSYTTTVFESGTTITSVVTQPPTTIIETVVTFIPTTIVSTEGILTEVTTLQETVTSTAPGETIIQTQTLPGETQTRTLPGETQTLPGQTQTLPGVTQTLPGVTQTLPGETQTLPGETQTQTLPGETQTQTLPGGTQTIPGQTLTVPGQTQTLPGQTQTRTLSASTQLVTETQPASTVTVTSVTTPPPVTVTVTTTAPPVPPPAITTTTTTTSSAPAITSTTPPSPPAYTAPPGCPNGLSGSALSGTCPADDRTTFTDASGVRYLIACDMDIRADNLFPPMASNSYTTCLQRCSTGSFTDVNGVARPCHGTTHYAGFCYFQFYTTPVQFTPRVGVTAAIRPEWLQAYVAPSGTCTRSVPPFTTTTTTTPAGPPPGYTGPITTSTPTTSTRTTTAPVTFTSAPPRLNCENIGWLVQEQTWYTVNIATGATVRNGTINLPPNVRMQAIGYNRLDGYIYGTNGLGIIQRFGLDLQPQTLAGGFDPFQTGDIDQSGHYWALRTAINPTPFVQFDVNPTSPSYGNVLRQGTIPAPQYFFADWAYVPGAGPYLWAIGVDRTGDPGNGQTTSTGFAYLYRFTQATLALEIMHTFGNIGLAVNNNLINFGAVYASSEAGVLYGSENFNGNIYRFTVVPPYTWAVIASGPTTLQNDGARCIDQPVAGVQTTASRAPAAPTYKV